MGLPDKSPIDSDVIVPALADLVADGGNTAAGFLDGQVKPIAIGTMVKESGGRTNGGNVATKLAELIEQVTGILAFQGSSSPRSRTISRKPSKKCSAPRTRTWKRSTERSS